MYGGEMRECGSDRLELEGSSIRLLATRDVFEPIKDRTTILTYSKRLGIGCVNRPLERRAGRGQTQR